MGRRKQTAINWKGWDPRLKQYLIHVADWVGSKPYGFGDYRVKLELWDGTYQEVWLSPEELGLEELNNYPDRFPDHNTLKKAGLIPIT